jgi:hypothetical protein
MRTWLSVLTGPVLLAGSALLAGCASAAPAGGSVGSVSPAASSAAGSSAAASTSRPATGGAAGATAAGGSCPAAVAAPATAGTLSGLQFTSAGRGWAVGADVILATADGGAHWQPQLSGPLGLTSVDFVNGQDGWAVGASTLLATTDGGGHWTRLAEPCPVIRSVHFISPAAGFAVAGGRDLANPGPGPEVPQLGGVVLATTDGGRSWQPLATPADAQTVCFSDAGHGWLGADGLLYRSADGGRHWTALTSTAGQVGSAGPADPPDMLVQCAGPGSAWALSVGPDAGMSQQPHVGYHADQSGATAIFAEQYFQTPGAKPAGQAPGSYAGPFSAISPTTAAFVDWCTACGVGTAPWDVAGESGAVLVRQGNVAEITTPEAASFLSAQDGWVGGSMLEISAAGKSRTQQRIVATGNGGRTWEVQYVGPWSAWTG